MMSVQRDRDGFQVARSSLNINSPAKTGVFRILKQRYVVCPTSFLTTSQGDSNMLTLVTFLMTAFFFGGAFFAADTFRLMSKQKQI